jgi:hypothetical protein
MKSKHSLTKSSKISLEKKLINKSRVDDLNNISFKKSFNKSKEKPKDNRTSSYDLNIRKSVEKKNNNRNSSIALLDMQITNTDFYPNTTQNKTYSNSTFGKYINNLASKKTIDNHTVNSSSITANTFNASKTTITNKIKTNKNLIINKLGGKVNVGKENILNKFQNSLTISKDENESPLPSSTKSKLTVYFINLEY